MKRLVMAVLLVLLAVLQMRIWQESRQVGELRERLAEQRVENRELRRRNAELAAEVRNLRDGTEAIEERARHELGLIREGEVFYQVVPKPEDP